LLRFGEAEEKTMATQQSTVDFLLDQSTSAGIVTFRRMFGEVALYCDSKVVALICDDQLFVKITSANRSLLDESHDAPPYPGAKPHLQVPGEKWDDREWLGNLLRVTADALPAPTPKKARKAKA